VDHGTGEFVATRRSMSATPSSPQAAPPFVLLSRGRRGEQDRDLWRAGDAFFPVARTAVRPDPANRCQPFAELFGGWQDARGK